VGDSVDATLINDENCFACGKKNPIGLGLHFHPDGNAHAVRAEACLDARYQGWQGIVHGGIVTTLVDDAMAHVGAVAGYAGVVGRINIRFRKPVPVGERVEVRAWVTWRRQNVFGIASRITDAHGSELATADGRFVGLNRIEPGACLGS
jgi:acyl dehydratase